MLPASIVAQLIEHARDDAPNEACGLIYRRGDRWWIQRRENASPYPWQGFRLGRALTYRGIRAAAKLHGVYHSHPASDTEPSAGDLRGASERPELAHYIVTPQGSFHDFTPA